MRALLAAFAAVQLLIGARPSWIGPATLVSLLLATALLAWMLRLERY
jgi:hypothetical protein